MHHQSVSKILALIEKKESEHQAALDDKYDEMGEKAFKGLRRTLPLTRQKLDWDISLDDAIYKIKGFTCSTSARLR